VIYYKTDEEVELLRQSNLLVSATHAMLCKELKAGVTTLHLNNLADSFIADHKAKAAFKGYNGFPFACCMSKNDAVVHGFPNEEELKDGDIISIDIGVDMNGFVGDSAYTYAIGEQPQEVKDLLRVTKESLYKGLEMAVVGNRIGDVSFAIEEHTFKKHGYGVVRELTGHGVGRKLHEDPEVPNYGRRGTGIKMQDALVIAVEPMITLGPRDIYCDDDQWTIKTRDGKYAAHYEHSICVRKGACDILSSFDEIEANEQANPNLDSSYYAK